jgi:hypothetical protein
MYVQVTGIIDWYLPDKIKLVPDTTAVIPESVKLATTLVAVVPVSKAYVLLLNGIKKSILSVAGIIV